MVVVESGIHLQEKKLRDVKPGEWFTKKPLGFPNDNQVWIKDKEGYDKASKTFCCTRWSDSCDQQWMKPDRKVYTDFIF